MIILGRLFYLIMWAVLVVNIFVPYTYPANVFFYIALGAMVLLHGLQALLFSTTLTQQEKERNKFIVLRFFLFGFVEMLNLKKSQKK